MKFTFDDADVPVSIRDESQRIARQTPVLVPLPPFALLNGSGFPRAHCNAGVTVDGHGRHPSQLGCPMRCCADQCKMGKITFRIRRIKPGSATSPLCNSQNLSATSDSYVSSFSPQNAPARFGVPSISRFHQPVEADAWCSGTRWEYRMTILGVLCSRSSANVRRSTPAITSATGKCMAVATASVTSIFACSSHRQ